MQRTLLLALPIFLAVGGWQFFRHYQIEHGSQGISLTPRLSSSAATHSEHAALHDTIRIASFNVLPLGEQKLGKPLLVQTLAALLQKFDLVALQGIRSTSEDALGDLVGMMNSQGGNFAYLLGPRVGLMPRTQQFAFIYNQATIDTDSQLLETVRDPSDAMRFDPLVGVFRARTASDRDAFTFSLVNVLVDPERAAQELPALGRLYRAVRDDGRREDDVILLGDFGADHRQLQAQAGIPYLACAISGHTTTVRRTLEVDNILYDRRATIEFANHAGFVDLAHELGLNMAETLELADHLPVWADFCVSEGGTASFSGR